MHSFFLFDVSCSEEFWGPPVGFSSRFYLGINSEKLSRDFQVRMRRPRAPSMSALLAEFPMPPPPPVGSAAWSRQQCMETCALARPGDVICVWWMASHGDTNDSSPFFIPSANTSPIAWRGVVEGVPPYTADTDQVHAEDADCIQVRWPSGLQNGPPAGSFFFPCQDLFAGSFKVLDIKLGRDNRGVPNFRMAPAPRIQPLTPMPHAPAVTGIPVRSATSLAAPLSARTFSAWMVPVLAMACVTRSGIRSDCTPLDSSTAGDWS
jgi:hypothetical protein